MKFEAIVPNDLQLNMSDKHIHLLTQEWCSECRNHHDLIDEQFVEVLYDMLTGGYVESMLGEIYTLRSPRDHKERVNNEI